MILTCPNCGTQYVVKDGAIPPEGRQVRCAACKHSWHQDPDSDAADEPTGPDAGAHPQQPTETDSIAEAESPTEVDQADDEESFAEATMIEPRTGPEAEERAYEEAAIEAEMVGPDADQPLTHPEVAIVSTETAAASDEAAPAEEDWNEPPHAEAAPDMFSPFAEADDEPKERSPVMTIAVIALAIIVLAGLFWLLAPADLKAKLGLAAASKSPLALVYTHSDRQKLESGNELLTVSGRVVNPTAKEQSVPPLQAQLTNRGGKVVYKWTIPPPAQSLAPGASASFNSAELKVPPGGEFLTITVGGPKAS